MIRVPFLLLFLLLLGTSCKSSKEINTYDGPAIGFSHRILDNDTIVHHTNFPSEYIDSRNVEVWLPKGYGEKTQKYQVLYMHDGQNVFNKKTSYGKVSWEIDEIMDSLSINHLIQPTIVVAIWNNGKKRLAEYMPEAPKSASKNPEVQTLLHERFLTDELLSDEYLKFIVDELKPFIDFTYNVSIKKEDTFMMGSSMGGLISLYAISKYPKIFGGVAAMSTHWPVPILGEAYIGELKETLPDPKTHKIYFDYGTETLDAKYEPYQNRVDKIMEMVGYEKGKNWMTLKFEGAAHNEASWTKRVHIPLKFLLE